MISRVGGGRIAIAAALVIAALIAVFIYSGQRDATRRTAAVPRTPGSPSPSGSPSSAALPTPTTELTPANTLPSGAPRLGNPAAAPTYTFSPLVSSSGATPSTHFISSDLTVLAGQQLVVRFDVASSGSVSLHAFPVGSSSYDIGTLRACLEFAGQASCNPGPFPNPAYWTVSANDLAHHSGYQLRVAPTVSTGPLLGIDVSWNGSHQIALSGLDLAGGCSAAGGGYSAGCGVRFKFTNVAPGRASISAGPGLLHLKVRDKSSGTTACDTKFSGSITCDLPSAAQWTGYLYTETGQPNSPASMNIGWP